MRRLHSRVARLEKAFGAALNAPCRVCGGGGRPGIEVRREGEPARPLPACPGCGKSKVLKIIILEDRPDRVAAP